ncbi:MlaA family lipoprotein [Marinivivus vitaminiproducens]|uniref:MlaA family lipoprotein n=1 Tax=Marinivivus vitaminiproducens TaxID=3035935 RepID=UPI0027A25E6A|nr:VacJ family lipoprotein [Geminicoccaceae bacterium SCSIO 64248]
MKPLLDHGRLFVLIAVLLGSLGACAGQRVSGDEMTLTASPADPSLNEIPAERSLEAAVDEQGAHNVLPLVVYDPIEPLNRGIYAFNYQFDRYVFIPLVNAYDFVTPVYVQQRVTNFFTNLGEVSTFANAMFQLRFDVASETFMRFLINSTLGVAGLYDPMTALGAPRRTEDFGQTLAYWGTPDGPYVVLPLWGPSNARDTVGIVTDSVIFNSLIPTEISDTLAWKLLRWGLQPIEFRHRTPFRYFQSGTPFEYDLVRYLYTKKREIEVLR